MTKRISYEVVHSREAIELLQSTLANYGPRLDENIVEMLSPFLREDEVIPQMSLIGDFCLRYLVDLQKDLIEVDQSRIDEAVQRELARRRFEEAESKLRQRIRFIRTAVEGRYGEEGLLVVPFRSADARTIDGLIDQAEYMWQSLDNFDPPETADPESSAFAVMPPPEVLAQSLRSRIDVLIAAREVLNTERKESLAAQVGRRDAVEAFALHERRLRALLKTMMQLADLEELADVLRVTRRSSRTPSTDPSTGDVDPPTSDGEPPLSQAA